MPNWKYIKRDGLFLSLRHRHPAGSEKPYVGPIYWKDGIDIRWVGKTQEGATSFQDEHVEKTLAAITLLCGRGEYELTPIGPRGE